MIRYLKFYRKPIRNKMSNLNRARRRRLMQQLLSVQWSLREETWTSQNSCGRRWEGVHIVLWILITKNLTYITILRKTISFFLVGVTSYEDITDCLKIVIKAVRHGQIKPWVCATILHNVLRMISEIWLVKVSIISIIDIFLGQYFSIKTMCDEHVSFLDPQRQQ